MLKAYDEEEGRFVYAWKVKKWNKKEVKRKREQGIFKCSYCKQELTFKFGKRRISHFAHKPNQSCQYISEPETWEHEKMKFLFYKWFSDRGYPADVEVKIGKFVVDVKSKHLLVEVQCSNLPFEMGLQKLKLYTEKGFYTFWIFSHDKKEWRKWFIVRSYWRRFLIYLYNAHLYFMNPKTGKVGIYKLRKRSDGYNLSGWRYAVINSGWYSLQKLFPIWYKIEVERFFEKRSFLVWRLTTRKRKYPKEAPFSI